MANGFSRALAAVRKARKSNGDPLSGLEAEAQGIVDKAARTRETANVTGNLLDAYGYAIWINGEMVRRGYATPVPTSSEKHKGWSKYGIEANTGRGYVDDFLDSYSAPRKGVHLVVVNAAYYARILEEGAQGRPDRPLSTKYRIITQISNDMAGLARRYGGNVEHINY